MDRNSIASASIRVCITSLSARRAWIEIAGSLDDILAGVVALRKESVDRNQVCIVARGLLQQVALRKESVDRNGYFGCNRQNWVIVALRKESVDRNLNTHNTS